MVSVRRGLQNRHGKGHACAVVRGVRVMRGAKVAKSQRGSHGRADGHGRRDVSEAFDHLCSRGPSAGIKRRPSGCCIPPGLFPHAPADGSGCPWNRSDPPGSLRHGGFWPRKGMPGPPARCPPRQATNQRAGCARRPQKNGAGIRTWVSPPSCLLQGCVPRAHGMDVADEPQARRQRRRLLAVWLRQESCQRVR